MVIRRTVNDAIGPLDEGLNPYFDDVDYCLNAKRAGWQTWFVPESGVMHLEGASTGIDARIVKRRAIQGTPDSDPPTCCATPSGTAFS